MLKTAAYVASQVIPLEGEKVILPNTAVAEIIGYSKPDSLPSAVEKSAPEWLQGMIKWRGVAVPLVSLEVMMGGLKSESHSRSRITVVNVMLENCGHSFFAFVTQGIPTLLRADNERMSVIDAADQESPGVACHVVLEGEAAVIPDFDQIEKMLADVFMNNSTKNKKNKPKK